MHKLRVESAEFYGALGRLGDGDLELNYFFDVECAGFDLGADAYDVEFEDYLKPKVLIEWLRLDGRDWRELRADISLVIGDHYRASIYASQCHNFLSRLRLQFARCEDVQFETHMDFDVDFESEGSGYQSTSGSLHFDAAFIGIRVGEEIADPHGASGTEIIAHISRFVDTEQFSPPVPATTSWGWQHSILRPKC